MEGHLWRIECANCGKIHLLMELDNHPEDLGELCLSPQLLIHCICGVYISSEQDGDVPSGWSSYVIASRDQVTHRWEENYSNRAMLN